ncbi:hypothetical protein [Streptomyces sp. CB01580]|uniref:hypothetical protein n=1 Tax=Streptomyces sp. CB01580 TaxID=1703933 RepID=UPI00093CDD10|nr:hypothetical protein [Streptomyces sp. CB01580]OKJ22247.1 hypothetical protein AMK22_34530 [Streptomyces sp. CB01580]
MQYTHIPAVPADQLRQLTTREAALALLQHLAKSEDCPQYVATIGSARQAFRDEQGCDVLLSRLSDAWCCLEAHALLSRVPGQSDGFRQLS